MRVLLLNPPAAAEGYVNRDLMGGMAVNDGYGDTWAVRLVAHLKYAGTRLPVIAFAYCQALLREAGHEVTILDASASRDGAAALAAATAAQPDFVLAQTSFAALHDEAAFLGRVRSATGARVAAMGGGARAFAAELCERGWVDVVVNGEPETCVVELANGEREVPGTTCAAGDRGARLVPDLDALPLPDWSGFDLAAHAYFPLLRRRPVATALASRGCPYLCHYCPYPVAQGAGYRTVAPERVVEELRRLAVRWGARSVLFRDPSFSIHRKRTTTLLEALASARLPLQWGCETRLDSLDDALVDLLADAGCRSIEVGVDAVDPHVLAESNRKGIDAERARALCERLAARGIATAGLFVLGLPGETLETVGRTIDFACGLGLRYANFEVAVPLPGTELHARAVRDGRLPAPRLEALRGEHNLYAPVATELDVATLRRLQSEALRRFYVRPRRVLDELTQGNLVDNARFLGGEALRFAFSASPSASA